MRFTLRSPNAKTAAAERSVRVMSAMSVMSGLQGLGQAGLWRPWHCVIIQYNRHRLYGTANNGAGPERSLGLRDRGARRRISRERALARRVRVEPERGGAAAGGKA